MIPMVDLRAQYHALKDQIDAGVLAVLESTQFILGPNVRALETELATYLGCKHAITCASGTDALHLALAALDLGPGDEVITTPFTFIATAEAIAYVGATPVFVDIDHSSFNIDLEDIEDAITERTKAILPVHLFGQACDMTRLREIADKHGLKIVEDCAQSFGGTFNGQQTGTFGELGCFSFFPSKNLGAYGDGGLVTCNDDSLAEKLIQLRNHGSRKQYHHAIIGFNSRLDEMQAAILRVKLQHIDQFNAERRRVAQAYYDHLCDYSIQLPSEADGVYHVYHQYTVLTDQREAVQKALKDKNIASAIYYPIPLHQQEAICNLKTDTEQCPIADSVSQQCLSLPVYPELSNDKVELICDTIKQVL